MPEAFSSGNIQTQRKGTILTKLGIALTLEATHRHCTSIAIQANTLLHCYWKHSATFLMLGFPTLPMPPFPPKLPVGECRQWCSQPRVGLLPRLAITALSPSYPADLSCRCYHHHALRLLAIIIQVADANNRAVCYMHCSFGTLSPPILSCLHQWGVCVCPSMPTIYLCRAMIVQMPTHENNTGGYAYNPR